MERCLSFSERKQSETELLPALAIEVLKSFTIPSRFSFGNRSVLKEDVAREVQTTEQTSEFLGCRST